MSTDLRVMQAYSVTTCNSCGVRDQSPLLGERETYFSAVLTANRARLVSAGWRAFAGRGRRDYCPNCGPSAGHRMREVTER